MTRMMAAMTKWVWESWGTVVFVFQIYCEDQNGRFGLKWIQDDDDDAGDDHDDDGGGWAEFDTDLMKTIIFLSQKLSVHGKRGQFWIWRQNWLRAFSKQLNSFFDLSWSFLRCSFVDFDKYIQECVSMGKQKRLIVTTITNNPIAFLSQFNIN